MRRLLLLLALLLAPLIAQADERILFYGSDIQVHEDGWLTVKETIRVRAEGKQVRRGIYRDFPTRYRDRFGNHVKVQFEPLAVLRDGSSEPWHTKSMSNGIRVYAGSAQHTLQPGVYEYTLTFRSNRQLGFFDEHDELYFNVVGTGWVFPVDRVEATVELPADVAASELRTDVYSGAYGSRAGNATTEVLSGRRIRFVSTQGLAPREGLTVAVGWPKGMIAEPETAQKVSWFLEDNGAALALLAGFLAVLAWYAWAWNKVGRDPDKGVIIPRFEPPEGLSPAASRYVHSMSFNRHAFTAAIISLAVKGQLTIEEDKKDFTLARRPDAPPADLSPGERAVLSTLLPLPDSRIEMENENHQVFQEARGKLKKELKKEYYGRMFKHNGLYFLVPVVISIVAAVIAVPLPSSPAIWFGYAISTLFLHGLFIWLMRAPTHAGRKVMDEIEGFKMYLGTAEQDRLDRMRSPQMTPEVFESFLPYAYALGVENKWCNRFAREMPREVRRNDSYHPGWYSGNMRGMGALHHLGDNFSSSFSSAIASASSPPGSSSGGGGGGFSGGGGGGGGGGGW